MRAPDTSTGAPIAVQSASTARAGSRFSRMSVAEVSARGSTLRVISVATARVPNDPRGRAKIIAGDVFHDPAAGLENLAAAGHRLDPRTKSAPRRLDPAWTGKIGHETSAKRAVPRAIKSRKGHRSKGSSCASRRAAPRWSRWVFRQVRENEFLWLVEGDAASRERSRRQAFLTGLPRAALEASP